MPAGTTNIGGVYAIWGQISTDTTGWNATTSGGFAVSKNVAITGVTATMYPSIYFTNATFDVANKAGIGAVDSYAGGVTLFAMVAPTATVTFNYVIIRG